VSDVWVRADLGEKGCVEEEKKVKNKGKGKKQSDWG
jgi:hypothetical protein